jgi:hypothetical protein
MRLCSNLISRGMWDVRGFQELQSFFPASLHTPHLCFLYSHSLPLTKFRVWRLPPFVSTYIPTRRDDRHVWKAYRIGKIFRSSSNRDLISISHRMARWPLKFQQETVLIVKLIPFQSCAYRPGFRTESEKHGKKWSGPFELYWVGRRNGDAHHLTHNIEALNNHTYYFSYHSKLNQTETLCIAFRKIRSKRETAYLF